MVYIGTPCYVSNSDYISHHGILGQKWGVRRFQNKDGTLTAAGKRRLAKIDAKQQKYASERKKLLNEKDENKNSSTSSSSSKTYASKEPSEPKRPEKPKNPHLGKSVFSMSDDELRKEISRLELEKRYRDYMKELYTPEPTKKKKRGKAFVDTIVKPSLTNVGKNVVENAAGMAANKIGEALGLDYQLYSKLKKKGESN